MGVIFNDYMRLPGPLAPYDTAEVNFLWNKGLLAIFDYGSQINSAATDSGSTPTTTLRGGLLLGKKTSDGTLVAYAAGNTDGSQEVYGILPFDLNMLDLTAVAQTRIIGVCMAGYVKASQLYGLDNQARQQMRGRFFFDDDFFQGPPGYFYPFKYQLSKTANYTVLATDNGANFDNTGASGAITFTLPAIANGYHFGFSVAAAQTVTISSNEGANIVAPGNAAASNIAFQTPGQQIGSFVRVYTNPAGTLWYISALNGPVTIS